MKKLALMIGTAALMAGCGSNDEELSSTQMDEQVLIDEAIEGPAPLAADVVTAWQQGGFLSGWMGSTEKKPAPFFAQTLSLLDEDNVVPAFSPQSTFDFGADAVWEKLPQPGAAFGLSFINPSFGDAHLKQVARFQNLTMLNLEVSSVTDAGLKELAQLKGLKRLVLTRTDVTDVGVEALQQALPDCEVFR